LSQVTLAIENHMSVATHFAYRKSLACRKSLHL